MIVFDLAEKLQNMQFAGVAENFVSYVNEHENALDKNIVETYVVNLAASMKKQRPIDDYLWQLLEVLESIIEKYDDEPFYPDLVYSMAYALYCEDFIDDSQEFAEKYFALRPNDVETLLLLAQIYLCKIDDAQMLEKALQYVDMYLETGKQQHGKNVKINILVNLKRFDEALMLLKSCEENYKDDLLPWQNMRIFYHEKKGEIEKAIELINKQLENEKDRNQRHGLFIRAFMLLRKDGEKKPWSLRVSTLKSTKMMISRLIRCQSNLKTKILTKALLHLNVPLSCVVNQDMRMLCLAYISYETQKTILESISMFWIRCNMLNLTAV